MGFPLRNPRPVTVREIKRGGRRVVAWRGCQGSVWGVTGSRGVFERLAYYVPLVQAAPVAVMVEGVGERSEPRGHIAVGGDDAGRYRRKAVVMGKGGSG
jgi:hypothetical protein